MAEQKPSSMRSGAPKKKGARGNARGGHRSFSKDLAEQDAQGSGSDSGSGSEEEEQREVKGKGVASLIEVANPNAGKQDEHKLTRKQKEELDKQKARDDFMRLTLEGKTDEAKKDLERLKQIRAEREAAAKRKKDELEAKEAAKAAAKERALSAQKGRR
eukprot:CAMPEP_0114556178 /NCGR_PEP_ID=MMETSP0114-20121206/9155_1 /TAXON_ID=31324 /ORGANISM="Goniomonas sp, Strain m" /LENGTH=158 /DNA_ID=CAMNT_0001741375 /DNA_START=23 /DNA_END=499 /DNA_ORIENTATION=+